MGVRRGRRFGRGVRMNLRAEEVDAALSEFFALSEKTDRCLVQEQVGATDLTLNLTLTLTLRRGRCLVQKQAGAIAAGPPLPL